MAPTKENIETADRFMDAVIRALLSTENIFYCTEKTISNSEAFDTFIKGLKEALK